MGYSRRRRKGDYRWVPQNSGIYRLYFGDDIVYIGETGDLVERLQQHEEETDYWGSYDYKSTVGVPKREREKMEERAIRRHGPSRQS